MALPDFRQARVLVAGDLMLDRYWQGGTSRISPEAPVPVVLVEGVEDRPGGAGNVALNIAALGGRTQLIGYCGRDREGDALLDALAKAGIECLTERLDGKPTITKLRVLSRHQQLIRLDFEERLDGLSSDALLHQFEEVLPDATVVVLSDYGKGTLNCAAILIDCATKAGKPVLVDPKGSDFDRYRGATLLTPNRSEFEAVVGACRDNGELVDKGQALRERLKLQALLVTRGEQGMTLLQGDAPARHFPAQAKEVYDVTGAGDTVISVLAAAMAAGSKLADSVHFANVAAGVVVGKLGTATVNADELEQALLGQRALRHGVLSLDELIPMAARARRNGEKIVATNGCFDILHPGHVHYLKQARALGDRLVVLVNSDASVARLKGPGRPVNPLAHRMTMLEALESVDWVAPFDEDTPREAIARLLPDVLVKGGDYQNIEDIAGHAEVLGNGGTVKLLSFLDGHSTTGLIEAIRKV